MVEETSIGHIPAVMALLKSFEFNGLVTESIGRMDEHLHAEDGKIFSKI